MAQRRSRGKKAGRRREETAGRRRRGTGTPKTSPESQAAGQTAYGSTRQKGRLILVATPIGNLGDLSKRAVEVLETVDLVAAEDTRVALRLLSSQGIRKPLIRFDEHAAKGSLAGLIARLEAGEKVALVSDAGSPIISDPGAGLVDAARERGIDVDAVPGPSAPIAALMLSGFYAQRFAFLGFPPRSAAQQKREFARFRESTDTLVLFESPKRLGRTLLAALEALGDRRAAVCREMTKIHQEVRRGRLSELAECAYLDKGEATVVIEGKRRTSST